jgi:hypothetical protein
MCFCCDFVIKLNTVLFFSHFKATHVRLGSALLFFFTLMVFPWKAKFFLFLLSQFLLLLIFPFFLSSHDKKLCFLFLVFVIKKTLFFLSVSLTLAKKMSQSFQHGSIFTFFSFLLSQHHFIFFPIKFSLFLSSHTLKNLFFSGLVIFFFFAPPK